MIRLMLRHYVDTLDMICHVTRDAAAIRYAVAAIIFCRPHAAVFAAARCCRACAAFAYAAIRRPVVTMPLR